MGVYEAAVTGCARCGGNHPALAFRRFTNPNGIYDRWAICPETGEPILMMVIEDFEDWGAAIKRRATAIADNPAVLAGGFGAVS